MATEEEGRNGKLSVARAVHKLQLSFLEDGPCSELQLFAAGALLSRSDYEDVVVERSIAGLCGYPRCPNPLPADRPRQGRYRISLSEHKVYDLEETYKFCCDSCVVESRAFSGSLRPERCSSAGLGKVAEVLRLFEKLSEDGSQLKLVAGGGDLGFSKLTIHERSTVVAGEVSGEDWIGPSDAIEGYVPHRDWSKGSDSKIKATTKRRTKTKAEIGESDFSSTIILGGTGGIPLPSSSSPLSGAASEKKPVEEAKEPALKPSLKSSKKKSGSSGRVRWADEEEVKILGDCAGIPQQSNGEADEILQRLDSAEACASALVQLADSVSSCEHEPGDAAASRAGLVLLPPPDPAEQRNSDQDEECSFLLDKGTVKWPKKTVLLDTDLFQVEDSWHDTPPEGFNLTLSPFATMWNALFGWLTCSSLAFVYGREEAPLEFLEVDGREYPGKVVLEDGRSSEIKRTMAACIARALPALAIDLRLGVPVSSIEKAMGRLLETMTFVDALPPFKTKQWSVISLLFLDALSLSALPAIAPQMAASRFFLHKALRGAQVTDEQYDALLDLILPHGRI